MYVVFGPKLNVEWNEDSENNLSFDWVVISR